MAANAAMKLVTVEGGYKSPFGFLVSTMYLERCLLRTSGSVESSTSSGIGLEFFLVSLHCSKFFRAQLVVFAVLAGMSPSESLASSLSVTVAKRSTEGRGCIRNKPTNGCGSSMLSRCGLELTTSAFPGQFVHEHMARQVGSMGQAEGTASLLLQAIIL